jgi:DNA sulfur modification protein DndD
LLLKQLSVENFGVFRGKHVFELSSSPDRLKPIVLIGGRNGAGKTTLFEGIRLCLYGVDYLGVRIPRSQYEQYLQNRIHKNAGMAISEGSEVALDFEHTHLGAVSNYRVRRRWKYTQSNIQEELQVFRNGTPVTEVPLQQLQDFLLELVPLGLSKLFFFDGEQIQRLAEDEEDNRNLMGALNALLGIDVIEHLQTDLALHLSRQSKRSNRRRLSSLHSKLQKDRGKLLNQLNEVKRTRAQLQSELDYVSSSIERQEHQLVSEGGGYADRRQQMRSRKVEVENEIITVEDTIRQLVSSLFPFAICPTLCQSLRRRLAFEEEYQKELTTDELVQKRISGMQEKFRDDKLWEGIQIDPASRNIIIERLSMIVQTERNSLASQTTHLIHHVSASDKQNILKWIDLAALSVPTEIRDRSNRLESLIRERREIEENLSRIPPEEALSPIVANLNKLHQRLGELNREISQQDELARKLDFAMAENERDSAKHEEELKQIEANETQVMLGEKAQRVLAKFSKALQESKIQEVSEQFVEAFNRLSTKKSLISRIHIATGTNTITLRRRNGTNVRKESLSAGEKQVYAVAMLIALAKVSRKPLPFIIDTPLARLDSEHRSNLVSNFLPSVSHQVIIFSTDTEIDRDYFDQLQPHVNRAYRLVYDETRNCSIEQSGYFWKPMEAAA